MTPDQIFTRELHKHSQAENQRDWKQIKVDLDQFGSRIFKILKEQGRPALWFRSYGLGAPSYADLLFHDSITSRHVCDRHGFRRALALVGMFAVSEGNHKEAGRAMLLLAYHSELRKRFVNRNSANMPRRRQKRKPTNLMIKNGLASFLSKRSHSRRNAASYLASIFTKRGKPVTARWVRDNLKKLGK